MVVKLPLFPLNTVLFPEGVLPLRVFETRYMDMVRSCIKSQSPFGVVLIKSGKEIGNEAVVERVGTSAKIIGLDMNAPGILNIVTLGMQRFSIESTERAKDGLLTGEIAWLAQLPPVPLGEQYAACSVLLANIIEEIEGKQEFGPTAGSRFSTPRKLFDTAWVADRLIEVLPVNRLAKQKLLELSDPQSRMEVVFTFLKQKGVLPEIQVG